MTGPGSGKHRLNCRVLLSFNNGAEEDTEEMPLDLVVYLHEKGKSGATVTHIDLEGEDAEMIKEVFGIGENQVYADYLLTNKELYVFKDDVDSALILECKEFPDTDLDGRGIIGGKEGGVFLGLPRPIIEVLEKAILHSNNGGE